MTTQTKPLFAILGALAFLGLGALMGGVSQPAASAQSPIPAGGDGRYRITPAGNSSNPYVYLLDTRTGRSWVANSPGDPWREIPQPK